MLFLSTSLNRKDPCRKKRHYRKQTNYPPSVYGSCWKVWWKVVWCSTVYSWYYVSTTALLCWYACFQENVFNPIWFLYFLLRYNTIKREHLLRTHAMFADALSSPEIFFLFCTLWNIRNIAVILLCFCHHISPIEILWFWGQETFAVCKLGFSSFKSCYISHAEKQWSPIYQKKERKKLMWEGISEFY